MLKSLFALIIALTMVACQPDQQKPEVTAPVAQEADAEVLEYSQSNDESCVCIEIYAPVCGADGETYSNSCHAECKNVEIVSEGACDSGAQER